MSRMFTRDRAGAFTLVEVVVAIVVLGVGLAAVLNVLSQIVDLEGQYADRVTGLNLAQQMLAEIDTQAFEEPNGTILFGLESGEQAGTRALFDDVDDYNGWSATPPVDGSGVPLPGGSGLTQQVTVQNVNEWIPDNPAANGTSGAKKITVTVLRGKRILAQLTALRMRNGNEEDYQ